MGFVYILKSGDENLFKIGKAVDVERRAKQLATGNPQPLAEFARIESEHPAECEKYLHHRLRTKRSRRSGAREFFEVEPAELEDLIRDVDVRVEEHVAALRGAKRLAKQAHSDQMLDPTDSDQTKHRRLLEVREALEALVFERDRLEADLKVAIGNAAGLDGIATWRSYTKHELNNAALKAEEPEVYRRYLREVRTRRFDVL
jgi:hypothetical protein